jgi:hypothetical protein
MGQRPWVMAVGVLAWLGGALIAAVRLLSGQHGAWRTAVNITLLVLNVVLLAYWIAVWTTAQRRQRTK